MPTQLTTEVLTLVAAAPVALTILFSNYPRFSISETHYKSIPNAIMINGAMKIK